MKALGVHSMSKVEDLTGLLTARMVLTGFRKCYMNGCEDKETTVKQLLKATATKVLI
jgi:predicted component of type VI protein secretion system